MLAIEINNGFLSLLPQTKISFSLNSPAYFGEDGDVTIDAVQGSYSYPVEAPLDGVNDKLLRYPSMQANAGAWVNQENCNIWCQGRIIMSGYLTVDIASVNPQTVSFFITVDLIPDFRNKQLNEITLGWTYRLGDNDALIETVMTDSAHNPKNYPFIFFPVWNPNFFSDTTDYKFQGNEFQNDWDFARSKFTASISSAATPFVKVSALLKYLFNLVGYNLNNYWQNNDELDKLVLYNNYSISTHYAPDYHTDPQFPGQHVVTYGILDHVMNFSNHLSKNKVYDFLKNLCRQENLGLFVSNFKNEAELIPMVDLMDAPTLIDWTSKVTNFVEVSKNYNYPSKFSFKSFTDGIVPDISTLHRFVNFQEFLQDLSCLIYLKNFDRWYYQQWIENKDANGNVLNKTNFSVKYELRDFIDKKYLTALLNTFKNGQYAEQITILDKKLTDTVYEAQMMPLLTCAIGAIAQTVTDTTVYSQPYKFQTVPGIKQRGSYNNNEPVGSLHEHNYQELGDDRLMLYRGVQNNAVYPNVFFPTAISEGELFTGNNTGVPVGNGNVGALPYGKTSLHWYGDNGLWNRAWARWYDLILRGKSVKTQLNLTINDLTEFSFKNKVRIRNMEYFVKKMDIVLSDAGVELATGYLITVA